MTTQVKSTENTASAASAPAPAKKSVWREFSKGILQQNPLLVLLLGTCPALAVTTSLINGLGMGLAATFVLICSNVVISAIRNIIPDKVRIPCYITVIASFVTILQFLLQAYVPSLNDALGIFIPLITVNCIILGRAEAFASKHSVGLSAIDGLGMGLGFTLALVVIGGLREILGSGSIAGWQIPFIGGDNLLQPILLFIMPPGGFMVFGFVIALALHLSRKFYAQHPDEAIEAQNLRNPACMGCGMSGACVSATKEATFVKAPASQKSPAGATAAAASEAPAASEAASQDTPAADPAPAEAQEGGNE